MSFDHFQLEADKMELMHQRGLAPKLHDCWVEHSGCVHFGYLVASLCDASAKDILAKRDFTSKEKTKINLAIDRLHGALLSHGDLKPSNIGVMLKRSGQIKSCCFLDCSGVIEHRNARDLASAVSRDWDNFRAHAENKLMQKPDTKVGP